MGSSLGPILANMIEMQKTIIKKFIDDKFIDVNDTLNVRKWEHLKLVHALNNFDKNLNFTVDTLSIKFKFIQMVKVFITKTQIQDNTKVIPHDTMKHFGFLPLYVRLLTFVIKTNYKQKSQEQKI